jgi:hypothetical protein
MVGGGEDDVQGKAKQKTSNDVTRTIFSHRTRNWNRNSTFAVWGGSFFHEPHILHPMSVIRWTSRVWPLLLVAIIAGCDGTENEPENQLANGFMRADIDGQEWSATGSVFAINTGGVFGLGGTDLSGESIGLGGVSSTGEQVIGMGNPANALFSAAGTVASSWTASATSGSGQITITELDAEHIAGTFEFVATATAGTAATGTVTVTDGQFDIEFNTTEQ